MQQRLSHPNHPGHSGRQHPSALEDLLRGSLPSHMLHPESDQLRDLLEELDDLIFLAIKGNLQSLDAARELWPRVAARVNSKLLEESREQYLRYANDVIRLFQNEEIRDPNRALAAIDIIELLTRD